MNAFFGTKDKTAAEKPPQTDGTRKTARPSSRGPAKGAARSAHDVPSRGVDLSSITSQKKKLRFSAIGTKKKPPGEGPTSRDPGPLKRRCTSTSEKAREHAELYNVRNRGSRIFLRSYMRRRNEATTSDGLCHSLRDSGISRRFTVAARAHQPPALLIRCRLYPRGDVII